MIPDDDIESMWGEIRPVRLPTTEAKTSPEVAPPEVEQRPPHPFSSLRTLLGAAAHHGCHCHGEFTSIERDIGFMCSCGMTFRIGLANARRTARGLFGYVQTVEYRETTAMRLTLEPEQLRLEIDTSSSQEDRT